MSLQITNLSKHYGDVAVFSNVSLTVARGEFVAIVGESGVGKSTLLNCMAGLDSWDAGTVSLDGTDLGTLSDDQRALLRRRQVGECADALGVPALLGIPLGHIDDQWTLPLGALATLDATARTLKVHAIDRPMAIS